MRAVLAMCLIALPALGCRIDLDHHEFQDAQPRLCLPQPTTSSCVDAVGHAELSYIQANIIAPKCSAFSECHGHDQTQDDLDLSTAAGTFNMAGSASELDPTRMLVVPGNVNASLLSALIGAIKPSEADPPMVSLPNAKATGKPVTTMPYQNPTMCCEKIDAVTAWIAAGAPNN
jgi:hypothetical protein